MPTVGLTACRKIEDYRQAVLHVGGEVRVLQPGADVADVAEVLAAIDGVLLSGGEDLAPARYGERPHPSVVDVNLERDAFEIALVEGARSRRLPIFAICRGIQVLNVACGGTLIQDIPTEAPGALDHRFSVPPHEAYTLAHEVWLEGQTLLSRLMSERLSNTDACEVNSRHHQSVKALAPGFVVSATAPDGIVEAIEDPAVAFCLGVQWHPENFWRTGEFRPLFEGFLAACKRD
jgi:putative glutamine amidotransferase